MIFSQLNVKPPLTVKNHMNTREILNNNIEILLRFRLLFVLRL